MVVAGLAAIAEADEKPRAFNVVLDWDNVEAAAGVVMLCCGLFFVAACVYLEVVAGETEQQRRHDAPSKALSPEPGAQGLGDGSENCMAALPDTVRHGYDTLQLPHATACQRLLRTYSHAAKP